MLQLIARAGHIVRRHQQHRHVTCAAKHLQHPRLKEMGSERSMDWYHMHG
jgi:hypothetical protein